MNDFGQVHKSSKPQFLYLKTDESSLYVTGVLLELNEMMHVVVESLTHVQHSINDVRIAVAE